MSGDDLETPINEFQEAEFLDSDAWDGVGEFDVEPYCGDVMLDAIQRARSYHPQWTLGRLMGHAACIARGQLNVSPTSVLDSELLAGLKALVPDAWEIQEDSEAEARRLARELRGGAGRGGGP